MDNLNNNRTDDIFDGDELRVRGNWTELKGKARQTYGNLTDDDFEYAEGQQEEWFGKLSAKIGKSVEEVKAWFRSL